MSNRSDAEPERMALADALRLVVRDDEETHVPARIEATVMQAWDRRSHREEERTRRRVLRWTTALTATACAALVIALWVRSETENKEKIEEDASIYATEWIAAPGMLLEEDAASLQRVRLSVEPSVLAASGYSIVTPDGTQPLDVEVLVGLDGVPRAIRRLDGSPRSGR